MRVLVSAIALGVVAGLAFGGDPKRLAAVRLVWAPLLFTAVALRLVAPVVPFAPLPLYLACLAGLVAVAWANRRLSGVPLIGAGAALNLVVVALNGGMPVDLAAAAAVGSAGPHDPLHVVLGPDTRLGFLADVIPFGLVRNVYSIGDFLDAAGAFWLPFRALRA